MAHEPLKGCALPRMMSANSKRIIELFSEALGKMSPADRQRFLVLKQACVQRAKLTSEFFPILAGEISPRLIEICSAGLEFVPAA